jgi:hypothetical protein
VKKAIVVVIALVQEGKAKLIVEATSNDLLRKTGRAEREVTVVIRPPTLTVDSEQHYLPLLSRPPRH